MTRDDWKKVGVAVLLLICSGACVVASGNMLRWGGWYILLAIGEGILAVIGSFVAVSVLHGATSTDSGKMSGK